MTLDQMLERIDVVADAQRLRLASDPLKVFEYKAAEEGARLFKQNNYQGDAPPVVHSWAIAKNWTDQQAADDILQEAELFHAALEAIRHFRLNGKYTLRNLPEDQRANYFDVVIKNIKSVGF